MTALQILNPRSSYQTYHRRPTESHHSRSSDNPHQIPHIVRLTRWWWEVELA